MFPFRGAHRRVVTRDTVQESRESLHHPETHARPRGHSATRVPRDEPPSLDVSTRTRTPDLLRNHSRRADDGRGVGFGQTVHDVSGRPLPVRANDPRREDTARQSAPPGVAFRDARRPPRFARAPRVRARDGPHLPKAANRQAYFEDFERRELFMTFPGMDRLASDDERKSVSFLLVSAHSGEPRGELRRSG